MKNIRILLLTGLVLVALSTDMKAGHDKKVKAADPQSLEKTNVLTQFYRFKQGFNIQVWLSNSATMGRYAWLDNPPDNEGMVYPRGLGIEHLFGAGPWIGAIVDTARTGPPRLVRAVSTGYEGWSGPLQEMFGNPDGRDSFYVTSVDGPSGEPNKRKVDDDLDGKIDEDELDGYDNDGDWNPSTDDLGADGLPDALEIGCKGEWSVDNPDPNHDNWDSTKTNDCADPVVRQSNRLTYTQGNGFPNHGEPHVDEDYAAISERDAYVAYSDIYGNPSPILNHTPLGIKIWQRSYAWRSRLTEPILPLEFTFVNVGRYTLDSVFVGFFADCDVGPTNVGNYFTRNSAGYLEDVLTAYVQNTADRPATPAGITVLYAGATDLKNLKYTFEWYPGAQSPIPDLNRYRFMSSGNIKPDEFPGQSDTRFFFAFGPVIREGDSKIRPGDSVKIAVALISGQGLTDGPDNLRENAGIARELYPRGWTTRPVPPAPPLKIKRENDRVTLNWKWEAGDPKCDPLETWDDSDKFLDALPLDNWRKRNPENACPPRLNPNPTGGRLFEGFRVWRSESPIYNPSTFALIRQYDVADDLNFEYGTGIEYSLIDSGLVRGKTYWYAVTSFSIPGISIVDVPVDSVTIRTDTLFSKPTQSDYGENAERVILPFEVGEVGEALVVPNPYRTDVDYTYEGGGWEGVSRDWSENKRVVWFIHLPPKCTIRVFTLAGDLINTIVHDDAVRTGSIPAQVTGQEEMLLVTSSGRAMSSGIYVFSVDSEKGRQVGKFVVIR